MGCVHTHQKITIIEGWGSPSCVWIDVGKIVANNQNVGKIGQVANQAFAFGLEHDKIQAWWALDILSKSMLENVW